MSLNDAFNQIDAELAERHAERNTLRGLHFNAVHRISGDPIELCPFGVIFEPLLAEFSKRHGLSTDRDFFVDDLTSLTRKKWLELSQRLDGLPQIGKFDRIMIPPDAAVWKNAEFFWPDCILGLTNEPSTAVNLELDIASQEWRDFDLGVINPDLMVWSHDEVMEFDARDTRLLETIEAHTSTIPRLKCLTVAIDLSGAKPTSFKDNAIGMGPLIAEEDPPHHRTYRSVYGGSADQSASNPGDT
ncbi:MAG: hypothetical protein ACI8W8_004313 [Rhodothermales bacterium]|jgi:hypothetical protein